MWLDSKAVNCPQKWGNFRFNTLWSQAIQNELAAKLTNVVNGGRPSSPHRSPIGPQKAALFGIKRFE